MKAFAFSMKIFSGFGENEERDERKEEEQMEQYTITGMKCAGCSARVEKEVSKVPGVTSCAVSLLTNSMGVEGTASEQAVMEAVEQAGFGISKKETANEKKNEEAELIDTETPELRKRLWSSLFFLLILLYFSMGHMMWDWPVPAILEKSSAAMGIWQMILTIAVMVINKSFFVNGFRSLLHKAPNMDTLVALGAGAAFVYSIAMLHTHDFYFESTAMILTLITVGKLLEAKSKGRTTNALQGLMKLAPKTARIQKDGKEIEIAVEQVKKDDIFVVRPGESIPVDGIVLEGNSAVNEAALTGESVPADKAEEDYVFAATLNQSGFLKCKAVKVGRDTTLSKIIQMVSDAAATKAPIAKAADKVSGIFVPAVIAIAAVTIAGWLLAGQTFGFALARGISVLVISCPCALGLATPVAIMVGSGVGAGKGILFKTAASLEETGRVKTVVLDKTGTITSGMPEVTDVLPAQNVSKEELMTLAYALEKRSEHPLAGAVLQYAERMQVQQLEVTDFTALPGNGLSAVCQGRALTGGNASYVESRVQIPETLKQQADRLAEEGKTPLYFAEEHRLLGVIAVADVIKEESPEAVKQLQAMGIRVVMLTGDNARTAAAIGRQVSVDKVISDVLPEGKEAVIRSIQETGKTAMVGDGINDAPALTRADIGIAIKAGTDIAIDAADVVLMKSRLTDVPEAIRLSRAVLKNIHENLFWAFFYNVIGIPLAAGVWIPVLGWQLNPMFAAAAMSLSSVCVVTNALRLNFFREK